MKYLKVITVLILFFLLSPSLIPVVSAQSDDKSLLDQLLIKIYEKTSQGSLRTLIPWGIRRFQVPEAFDISPNNLSVEYLSRSEIIIGIKDPETGGYISAKQIMEDLDPMGMFTSFDWEFKLNVPDSVPNGTFIAHFDPDILIAGTEGEMKTTLRIDTAYPETVTLPKNLILSVNISRYVTAENLYIAPSNTPYYPGKYIIWFLMSLGPPFFPFPFGPYYSGKRVYDESMYVDILVHTGRFHLAEIIPPSAIEMSPNEIKNIPIEIRNMGSHVDTFNFKVSTNKNSELIVSPPPAITLGPNEVGYTSVGVISPEKFQDLGTTHSIHVHAYSIYDNNTYFNNTITVVTRGAYVSELNMLFSLFILFIIILFVVFFWFKRKIVVDKLCKKPEKPWTKPEEKKKLEKLKEKDKKKYESTLKKMEKEYEEEMALYRDMRKAALKRAKKKETFFDRIQGLLAGFVNLFKKPEKLVEEKEEVEKPKKEIKKIEEKPVEIKEVKEPEKLPEQQKPIQEVEQIPPPPPPKDKKEDMDKWMKEEAIRRVLRQQEKQKRKLRM